VDERTTGRSLRPPEAGVGLGTGDHKTHEYGRPWNIAAAWNEAAQNRPWCIPRFRSWTTHHTAASRIEIALVPIETPSNVHGQNSHLPTAVETMMLASADFPGALRLDYEAWRELVREMCGGYNPEGIEPSAFSGWMRPVSVCGFTAAEVGCNAQRVERTYRDVRLDGADQYLAVFQLAGQSAVNHNAQAAQLSVGDVILVDAARPATFFAGNPGERWESLTLVLPRQSLVSHLGFEPQGGLYRRGGTSAGRLLIDLIRNAEAVEEDTLSPTDSYMKLVVYDLVGALFAPSSQWRASRHADKVFMRVRDIIKDGFADPDFGPCELAAKAGISLRYLHKLFTQRDSTCSEFIYSARLNYASQLLHRR
jgi:AraC family transcriptional regulator, positive regulator of tynA and feaB